MDIEFSLQWVISGIINLSYEATAIKDRARNVYCVDSTSQAVEIGNMKTMNVLLMGALIPFLDIKIEKWRISLKNLYRKNWKKSI